MNIECIIKREGGSKHEIDNVVYHFAPNEQGAHVADVANKAHQKRFLSIPESFEVYDPTGAAKKTSDKDDEADVMLVGSSVHDEKYTIGDKEYSLGDVVTLAWTRTGKTKAEWNALPDDERHSLIDAELDAIAAAVEPGSGTESREELIKQYESLFGKKPDGRMSTTNIKKAVDEKLNQ